MILYSFNTIANELTGEEFEQKEMCVVSVHRRFLKPYL